MNSAIVVKTLRDVVPLTLVLIFAILVLDTVFVRVAREVAPGLQAVADNIFLRKILRLALGGELFKGMSATTYVTIGLVHPLLFAVFYAFLITTCTRILAGEVDSGTADLLLTLPVTRVSIYLSTTVVWVGAALLLSVTPWLGIFIGEKLSPLPEPVKMNHLWIALGNLMAYNVCVGAITMMFAAILNRRVMAIAAMLGILITANMINFVAQFWDFAEKWDWLSLMHYYDPLEVVRTQTVPALHLVVLLGLAAITWTIGLIQFARRDIASA